MSQEHTLPALPALDATFHALADPARREMVERLCRGPASVSELARPQRMTLSAVLQHLSVLQASGLVRSEKLGRVRTCHLEPAALRTAERWIAARRTTWERRLDRLGRYLATHPEEPAPPAPPAPPAQSENPDEPEGPDRPAQAREGTE